jgi:F-type H+-transporting ATPase subunit alpha
MRNVSGGMRIDLAQYQEMSTFAQFGTADLDRSTRMQLERGQRITEVLKQPQYVPLSLEQQVIILYAVTKGHFDDIPVASVRSVEEALLRFMETNNPDIGKAIAAEKVISSEIEEKLKKAITDFKSTITFEGETCILPGGMKA